MSLRNIKFMHKYRYIKSPFSAQCNINIIENIQFKIFQRFYTYINTFTAIVDLSRSNFSIAHTPLFQLKSAM